MQKLYPAEVQSLNSCVISGGGRTLSQGGGASPLGLLVTSLGSRNSGHEAQVSH